VSGFNVKNVGVGIGGDGGDSRNGIGGGVGGREVGGDGYDISEGNKSKRVRLSAEAEVFSPSESRVSSIKLPSFHGMSVEEIEFELSMIKDKKLALDSAYSNLDALEFDTREALRSKTSLDPPSFLNYPSSSINLSSVPSSTPYDLLGRFPTTFSFPGGAPLGRDPLSPFGPPPFNPGTTPSHNPANSVISPDFTELVNRLVDEKMKKGSGFNSNYSPEFKLTLKRMVGGEPTSMKLPDSNFLVSNADGKQFIVPRVDSSTLIQAKNSLFASRVFNPEAFAAMGEYSGVILKVDLTNRLCIYAENWGIALRGPDSGFRSLSNLSLFEKTHIWSNLSTNSYTNFTDFVFGFYTSDRFFSSSGVNFQAKLNIFSPVKGPWPKSEGEVDVDFALKVVYSWEQWFVTTCGDEIDTTLGVTSVVESADVFKETIQKIRDSSLKHLPTIYFLHLFNEVLLDWFRLTSSSYRVDGIYYAFENRSSPLLLLRDMLGKIDFRTMDLNLYYSQSAKGKILKSYVSEGFVKNEYKNELRIDTPMISKGKLEDQVCTTNACAVYLNEKSIGPECFMIGGVCARIHISSEKGFMDAIPSLLNLISKSKSITPVMKLNLSTKMNSIQESGFK